MWISALVSGIKKSFEKEDRTYVFLGDLPFKAVLSSNSLLLSKISAMLFIGISLLFADDFGG